MFLALINMRIILIYSVLFLASNCIAAWLCMFDYTLTMRPWSALLHLPPLAWLVTIAVNPLVELFFNWWAHLLAIVLYAGIVWAWVKYRGTISQPTLILIGMLVGGGFYLLIEIIRYQITAKFYYNQFPHPTESRPWLTSPGKVVKLLLVYATTGFICGWLYYRWVVAKKSSYPVVGQQQ